LASLRELLAVHLFSRDVVPLVSRLTTVSEIHPLLASSGPRTPLAALVPADRDEDLLALHPSFHVLLDLFGTALVGASPSSLASFSASFLSVSVVSHCDLPTGITPCEFLIRAG
jgi:hypothetical protein